MVLTSLASLSIALAEGVNDRDLVLAALLGSGRCFRRGCLGDCERTAFGRNEPEELRDGLPV